MQKLEKYENKASSELRILSIQMLDVWSSGKRDWMWVNDQVDWATKDSSRLQNHLPV
jgi:hypothetical protein